VRADDIACRYGGEEFALVLPDASLDVSCERAELLREGVKELRIEYLRQHLGPVTMSIGVSLFPDHGDNPEALIRAADAALYRAKRTDVTAWKSPRLLTDPLRLTTRRL
jgi:diguanylate cyclase (GGDEF)-like protein